jgi:hypothetical protein
MALDEYYLMANLCEVRDGLRTVIHVHTTWPGIRLSIIGTVLLGPVVSDIVGSITGSYIM